MPDCEQDRVANFGCYLSRRLCITTSVKEKVDDKNYVIHSWKGPKTKDTKRRCNLTITPPEPAEGCHSGPQSLRCLYAAYQTQ
jgi:hypothetical protein